MSPVLSGGDLYIFNPVLGIHLTVSEVMNQHMYVHYLNEGTDQNLHFRSFYSFYISLQKCLTAVLIQCQVPAECGTGGRTCEWSHSLVIEHVLTSNIIPTQIISNIEAVFYLIPCLSLSLLHFDCLDYNVALKSHYGGTPPLLHCIAHGVIMPFAMTNKPSKICLQIEKQKCNQAAKNADL